MKEVWVKEVVKGQFIYDHRYDKLGGVIKDPSDYHASILWEDGQWTFVKRYTRKWIDPLMVVPVIVSDQEKAMFLFKVERYL